MRSYQVHITVQSPITLSPSAGPDDKQAILRALSDLLTEASLDVEREVRQRLDKMREQAAEAGLVLDIPSLDEPMGVTYGITDVTGHVGKKWQPTP